MERTILHVDLNNFFASVECLYAPELWDRPIAVAGDPQARHGIVLAKNMPARRCGVQTAEPLWRARQKCPDILFVAPHYRWYTEYSRRARAIYAGYTDQVEAFGLDECWLDVTGSRRLFGSGRTIADDIREKIRSRLGLTVSVGVSFNKVFAKLGSDMQKPDATTLITRSSFREQIWPLPADQLLFTGAATAEKLRRIGVCTIGELAQADAELLQKHLGQPGMMLWRSANGLDDAPVARDRQTPAAKSIGNGTTTPRDMTSAAEVRSVLRLLCDTVSARLRQGRYICRTVQISVRDDHLFTYERQAPMTPPGRTADALFRCAYGLFAAHHPEGTPVRSLSVRACELIYTPAEQLSFLEQAQALEKQERLETTVDGIRARYGEGALRRGALLNSALLSPLDPAAPCAFRSDALRRLPPFA